MLPLALQQSSTLKHAFRPAFRQHLEAGNENFWYFNIISFCIMNLHCPKTKTFNKQSNLYCNIQSTLKKKRQTKCLCTHRKEQNHKLYNLIVSPVGFQKRSQWCLKLCSDLPRPKVRNPQTFWWKRQECY